MDESGGGFSDSASIGSLDGSGLMEETEAEKKKRLKKEGALAGTTGNEAAPGEGGSVSGIVPGSTSGAGAGKAGTTQGTTSGIGSGVGGGAGGGTAGGASGGPSASASPGGGGGGSGSAFIPAGNHLTQPSVFFPGPGGSSGGGGGGGGAFRGGGGGDVGQNDNAMGNFNYNPFVKIPSGSSNALAALQRMMELQNLQYVKPAYINQLNPFTAPSMAAGQAPMSTNYLARMTGGAR